jgi:D123
MAEGDTDVPFLAHRLARKAEHRPFDFDQYYEQIADFSWRSAVLALAPATARAMVRYYQRRYNSRLEALTAADVELLRQLESDVDDVIHSGDIGDRIFVRMTNRSPKDGEPLDTGRLRREYEQELERELALNSGTDGATDDNGRRKSDSDDDDDSSSEPAVLSLANSQMVAASAAQLQTLSCSSGREVVNLLLSSERVFVDLLLALDCTSDPQDEWGTFLILREWDSDLQHDWEFRVFVHKNQVTAVSQYNHYCVFRELAACDADRLLDQILEFWEVVQDKIEADSYIVDLALLRTGEWRVIELNPFATSTGGCLFDWSPDGEVLRSESPAHPPPFRIRRTEMEDLEGFVSACILPQISEPEQAVGSGRPWDEYLPVVKKEEDDESSRKDSGCCVM